MDELKTALLIMGCSATGAVGFGAAMIWLSQAFGANALIVFTVALGPLFLIAWAIITAWERFSPKGTLTKGEGAE